MKVFISYSSKDRNEALTVRRILETNGCDVWLDAFDLDPNPNLRRELGERVSQSDLFCLLLSPTAVASSWVADELKDALASQPAGLRILPIILRPCQIPETLKDYWAFSAFEDHQGLESEHIRLELIRAVLGGEHASAVKLDEAFQAHLADLAEQQNAAKQLPERSREVQRVRDRPIRKILLQLDPDTFSSDSFLENPFILELQLHLGTIFHAPMRFYFARFQEGNTWPEEFELMERPYTDFEHGEPRIDSKFVWNDWLEDLPAMIDGTDLGMLPATFRLELSGANYQPNQVSTNRFHANIQALACALEIPALTQLIRDRAQFELILHQPASKTAQPVKIDESDIDLRVIAEYPDENLQLTLFKGMRNRLETVLLSGSYLSGLASSIERDVMLGLYLESRNQRELVESNQAKRCEVHRLSVLQEPAKFDWDPDRRLVARLLDNKAMLFGQRGGHLRLFGWDEIPGRGSEMLQQFLAEDFRNQDYFAYVVYDDAADIECAKFTKDVTTNAIVVESTGKRLEIRLNSDQNRASAVLIDPSGDEHYLHDFYAEKGTTQIEIYNSNLLNVLNYCLKIRALLGPLLFERRPHYEDGHLFSKAVTHLARHHLSVGDLDGAQEYATDAKRTAERMLVIDSGEEDYERWKARSLFLLAETYRVEKGKAAETCILDGVSSWRDLFESLPNVARFNDLKKALQDAANLSTPTANAKALKDLKKELNSCLETDQKISAFLKKAKVVVDNYRVDVWTRIADGLRAKRSHGSKNAEKGTFTMLSPKTPLDRTLWTEFDKALRPCGFTWVQIRGEQPWVEYWERWEPKRQSPDVANGSQRRSAARQTNRKSLRN